MGGKTGEMKQRILEALYEAEQSGRSITESDLVKLCGRSASTINGHLRELREVSQFVRDCGGVRGWIVLTPAGRTQAQASDQPSGLPFRGIIAAGPAVRIEQVNDIFAFPQFDPTQHFALKVHGTSMIHAGILDGDIVIFRRVANWMDVPDGKIVAARVPEGSGGNDQNWHDQFDPGDGHLPPLDHVTLKQFTAQFRAYVRQGIEQHRATPILRGNNSVFQPHAVAIDGVMVYLHRDCQ